MPQSRIAVICAVFLSLVSLSGCAYHFQSAHNPLLDLGIRKIYVAGFRNDTYRPGIEHYFTTAMVREIGRSKSFVLVNNESDADAVLRGVVTAADSSGSGATKNFDQTKVGGRSVDVATEYNASVSCMVELRDRQGRQVFSQSVSGDKVHPGSVQQGDAGSTAPLVNDSEHRLAVQFLAAQMMDSVYQRMVDTF